MLLSSVEMFRNPTNKLHLKYQHLLLSIELFEQSLVQIFRFKTIINKWYELLLEVEHN